MLGLLVLLLGVRLSFLGTGALAFPDEERYYRSVEAVEALVGGDVAGFCERLSQTQGRPGDALWRVAPASLQVLLAEVAGVSPHSPASLLIPVAFNYLIVLCSLLAYYRIGRLLLRNEPAALLSTLVYGCLVNTNLYIRHILPYDAALLCFFVAVYWVLRLRQHPERRTYWAVFFIGALSALTFAIYPGYNAAVVVGWLMLLEKRAIWAFNWVRLLGTSVVFALGAAGVLLLFELLTLAGGSSYLESCISLSSTITQGDFADGFSFLFNYLFEAERSLGYLLVGLGAASVPVLLYRLARRRPTVANYAELIRNNMLLLSMVLAFLAYAVMVFYQEKLVFYGRILHLYLPFFVLLLAKVLYPATHRRRQFVPVALVAGIALYSFGVFTVEYHRIAYPLTVLYQQVPGLKGATVAHKSQTGTADNADYYLARAPLAEAPPTDTSRQAVLVNVAFLYPIHAGIWCNTVELPPSYKLLFSAPHFLTLPAYPFEGYRAEERDIISHCKYQCQVYVQE
ncbi:hypothetical protein [Hymenobacter glacialis]|uniref:hypothetical protein n=1 Tax=Hymenobacter glacialis TaxID=1908236 RepID=UPI001300CDAD|nr:hypothetical protein [Hymenobacter glacialis]